ncbi:hypothetical protein NC651_021657 [Populus alba x Populus x berolinensis]|nr:hypothetical protein NC651_021657 [Populus alba x Populus x berolinensis]
MYTNLGTDPFYSRGALCLQECRAPTTPCNHRNPAEGRRLRQNYSQTR